MGVSHSMEQDQVERVSKALRNSSEAIQGINQKFDTIDDHWRKAQGFNEEINAKVDKTLESFQRLDDTFNDRIEMVLEAVVDATDNLSGVLEATLDSLQQVNIRREIDQIPKAVIPLAIPLIILLIELAVANAYMGILLASITDVRNRYSRYLLGNASSVLIGLTVSLVWLAIYRVWLSMKEKDVKARSRVKKKDQSNSQVDGDPHNRAPSETSSEKPIRLVRTSRRIPSGSLTRSRHSSPGLASATISIHVGEPGSRHPSRNTTPTLLQAVAAEEQLPPLVLDEVIAEVIGRSEEVSLRRVGGKGTGKGSWPSAARPSAWPRPSAARQVSVSRENSGGSTADIAAESRQRDESQATVQQGAASSARPRQRSGPLIRFESPWQVDVTWGASGSRRPVAEVQEQSEIEVRGAQVELAHEEAPHGAEREDFDDKASNGSLLQASGGESRPSEQQPNNSKKNNNKSNNNNNNSNHQQL
ncbi:unnamed protein product, partial [Polarella glacialis]